MHEGVQPAEPPTTARPGRRYRWYVLPRTMCAPSARSAGVTLFTAPGVPTGWKVGVSRTPWAVVKRPRRARPSSARSWNWSTAGDFRPRGRRCHPTPNLRGQKASPTARSMASP